MTLYFEDVKVGDLVPPFQRTTGLENWNRFAAANDEFMPVHMDPDAARARGQKDTFGMGGLRQSYLQSMLRAWMDEEGAIRRFTCQHRGVNFKNDVLTAKGSVETKRVVDGTNLVDLKLWVENQTGEIIDTGAATVALPGRRA